MSEILSAGTAFAIASNLCQKFKLKAHGCCKETSKDFRI